MFSSPAPKPKVRFKLAAGVTVVAIVASVYAYRAVFARPGEDALRLLPADSLLVASLDLSPSPEQALTFKHIEDALARNGVKEPIQRSILDIADQSPAIEPIRELTTRSVAFGLIPSQEKKGEPEPVLLMPLSDGQVADHVLRSRGVAQFWKGTQYFRMPNSQMGMMVVGSTLVLSPAPDAMHEIAEVASGQNPSVTTSDTFQQARAKEPSDANLMAFVSPKLMEMGAQGASASMASWIGFAATIHDDGLALTFHGKYNANDPASQAIESIKPLRSDLSQALPAGAYGVVALSQPSKYLDAVNTGLKSDSQRKSFNDFKESIGKQTSIDVDTDVSSAFSGDAVLAAYPSESQPAGVDLLLVVDDQNGANPSVLADKVQAFVDQQSKQNKDFGANWLTPLDRSDLQGYRLSDKVQEDMRKSFKGGSGDPIRYNALFGNKTVAWAKVNGAVMIATSQDLLDRAADAYEGKSPALSTDPDLKKSADASDGSQALATFALARIADGVRNTADESKMDAHARATFDQAIAAFSGLKAPFEVHGRTTPAGDSSGELFIPMDYDKLIDLIGGMTRHN